MKNRNILQYGLYGYTIFVIIAFIAQIKGLPLGDHYEGAFQKQFWDILSHLPLWQKLMGILMFGIGSSITLVITYVLSLAIKAQHFLSVARCFSKIARYFIIYTVWGLLSEPLYSVFATAHLPKGHRILSINVNSHHIKWFLIALFFYFLVEQMKKAYLIEKEQEMTI